MRTCIYIITRVTFVNRYDQENLPLPSYLQRHEFITNAVEGVFYSFFSPNFWDSCPTLLLSWDRQMFLTGTWMAVHELFLLNWSIMFIIHIQWHGEMKCFHQHFCGNYLFIFTLWCGLLSNTFQLWENASRDAVSSNDLYICTCVHASHHAGIWL